MENNVRILTYLIGRKEENNTLQLINTLVSSWQKKYNIANVETAKTQIKYKN